MTGLSNGIHGWNDRHCEMVGVIPADIVMHERPQGHGYVRLQETADAIWPGAPRQAEFSAHEFHYSSLENVLKTTSLPEFVLGLSGIAIALAATVVGVRVLRFMPVSLADEQVDPHYTAEKDAAEATA